MATADDRNSSSYDTGTDSENESNPDVHRKSVNVWDLPNDTNTINHSKTLQNTHQYHSTGYIQQKQQSSKPNNFQYTNPPQANINKYARTPPPPQCQTNTHFPYNHNQQSNSTQHLHPTPQRPYSIQPSQTMSAQQQIAYVQPPIQYSNSSQYLHNEQKYNPIHTYSNSTPNVLQIQQNRTQNNNVFIAPPAQNSNAFTPPPPQSTTQHQTFTEWKNNRKIIDDKNLIQAQNVKQQWLNSQKQNGSNNAKSGRINDELTDYSQRTLKAGYMQKEGGFVKSWKRRWFVLRINGKISYYQDENGKKPLGTFDCNGITKISKESWSKKRFGLKVTTRQRNWKFVCLNNQERVEWYNAFQGIVMFKK